MNGNLRVGNLFGIPFFVNVSWFLVLALVTWDYGGGLASSFPSLGGATPWVLGLVTALLLFASVLAHELGHSFAALKQGIGVNSITLFLFGGLAALERESDTPKGAFWVAIAGPLVSFALFALFFTANQVLPLAGPAGAIIGLLAYINLALGAFNLIPGLPLDGGNVLKSLVWKLTGNPYKGIVFASRVGQFIGWTAILTGVAAIFGISRFGSIWTLLIGLFLLQNANRTAQSGQIQSRLEGLTAADAVLADSPIVTTEVSLREFADTVLLSGKATWRRFLVTNADDQLVGTVFVDALRSIPKADWTDKTVGQIMQPADDLITVDSDQPLLEILKTLEQQRVSTLAVLYHNGALMGLLERTAVLSLLQKPQVRPA